MSYRYLLLGTGADSGAGAGAPANARITDDGSYRVTDDGSYRVANPSILWALVLAGAMMFASPVEAQPYEIIDLPAATACGGTDTIEIQLAAGGAGSSKSCQIGNLYTGCLDADGDGTCEVETTATPDATVLGTLKVRQSGGTPGTDEVTILHDGSQTILDSKQGDLYLRRQGTNTVRLQANYTSFGNALNAIAGDLKIADNLNVAPDFTNTALSVTDDGTDHLVQLSASATQAGNVLEVGGDVEIEGVLSVLQDGGVAGTDEVTVRHYGSYGEVKSFDGQLYLRAASDLYLTPANGAVSYVVAGNEFRSGTSGGFFARRSTTGGPSDPLYTIVGDTNTGISLDGSDGGGLVAGGSTVATWSANGLDIEDQGTRPTCDSSTRGNIWTEEGGAGVADVTSQCLKSAADTYSWVTLATG